MAGKVCGYGNVGVWGKVTLPLGFKQRRRALGKDCEKRTWLSEGGSRKRVSNQEHFDHLVGTYLPQHGGWKWSEERGLHR
jgi:hypothetical protein